jgi:DNA-binding GntR family transcriptional regulator
MQVVRPVADTIPDPDQVAPVTRDTLTERVYRELRTGLMEGRFWPGDRFKIRPLAAAMGVSETPVREALMQLAREKGIRIRAARSFSVAELTLAQYLELRRIRVLLEGLAAEAATRHISPAAIDALADIHESLIAAETRDDWRGAMRANALFHQSLFKHAGMPELLDILETIWLRNGPLLNYQYSYAPPIYPTRHHHLNILDALRSRQPEAARAAIQADLLEGGQSLVTLLEQLESGQVTKDTLRKAAEDDGA